MAQPSSRWNPIGTGLAGVAASALVAAAGLALAGALAVTQVAGASTRARGAQHATHVRHAQHATDAHHARQGQGASSHGALVKEVASKKYGEILVSSGGRTLYMLTADTSSSLACTTGACTGLWPPLMTSGKPRAGKGISARRLGTVKRGSGRQVTYDGHPLYLYAGDTAAGQVNGEGVSSFGGTWYVLSNKGAPVKAALTSSTSGTESGSGGSGGSGGW